MKEGRPSLTAFYVAFSRAVATHDPVLSRACQDEVAELLLPRPLGRLVTRAKDHPALLWLLRRSALGMAEHMALRTRLIDDAVNQAALRGARQLVVLGAGLDSRAHRMLELKDVVVFEVDHPSTQVFKREKARDLPVVARELRYVSCDFERESFGSALSRASFDASTASIWIWEGVTMYLPMSVIASSLEIISATSALHSRLVASYLTPMPAHLRALQKLGFDALEALAEPVHSQLEPEQMAELLRTHGFFPTSDSAPRQVTARYGVRFPPFAFGAPSERIIVADKRASLTPATIS